MQGLENGDLTIDISRQSSPDRLRLAWRGKSNARQPADVLGPFFDRVINDAASTGAEIEMHFEQIDHFNSSTITALIQLIQKLRAKNIKLAILYDPGLKWQKLSFDALRVFETADGLLEIRGVGA